MTDQSSNQQLADTGATTFKNLDDLTLDSLEENTESPEQAPTNETDLLESEEILSVNSNTTDASPEVVAETKNVEEVKEETQKAPESKEIVPPKRVIPKLEAEIAEDAKQAKEEGKTVELLNSLNGHLEKLVDAIKLNNPVADKIQNILDTVSFDPDQLNIKEVSTDPMSMHTQLELLKSARPDPVYPIIALKSGYKADIAALNNNDKIELRNLTGSATDQTLKLLRLIHSKIRMTSIGRINFNRFIEITAEEDYETFIYGLFSASFPNATEYNMSCPHCATEVKLPLFPSQLIEVIDKERAGAYVKNVLANYDKGEEFLKDSLVNTHTRIVLPKSKAVVEFMTPTLKHMIDNSRLIEESKVRYSTDLVNVSKYIKGIYILDIETFQSSNKVVHMPLRGIGAHLDFIAEAAAEDLKAIRTSVSQLTRSYAIHYRIPDFTCPNGACAKPITNVNVDMTELLFFGIIGELTA